MSETVKNEKYKIPIMCPTCTAGHWTHEHYMYHSHKKTWLLSLFIHIEMKFKLISYQSVPIALPRYPLGTVRSRKALLERAEQ
jgi:hypothetical protein